jgi:hypothetical protein
MTVDRDYAASGTPDAGEVDAAVEEVLGEAFLRLNPVDGLFLRAEHLQAIQNYARELVLACGRGGGAGVVHGYTGRVSGARLQVEGGLAFTTSGQPLLLDRPVSLALAAQATSSSAIVVVELLPGSAPTGDFEQVFGLVCDDPCDGGEQFRPYVAEGVRIRLRPVALSLPEWRGEQFRSAVASAYFERERTSQPSLLPTSGRHPEPHADLGGDTWSTGTDVVDQEGVPIGMLVQVGSHWEFDAWAARRDRIEPPPERGWAFRTGRRPWDVFLAQVHQFQAQLAHLRIPAKVRSAVGGAPTLPEHFVELPPAGYLPVNPSADESVDDQITRLFGPGVDLRFCTARPDEIGLALERARHLDRIPLSPDATRRRRPQVDVIVPGGQVSTRSAASSSRFFVGEVVTKNGGGDRSYDVLARLSYTPGGKVSIALAGAGPSGGTQNALDGLWLELSLDKSPFDLSETMGTEVRGSLVAHQRRNRSAARPGKALQWFTLDGRLQCSSVSRDAGTGLPSFEGSFSARVHLQFGSTRSDPPPITGGVRLTVRRVASSEYALEAELVSQSIGPVSESFELHVRDGREGWHVTFDSDTGAPRPRGIGVTAELDELRPDEVPLSRFRWRAEEGLATVSETGVQLDAVTSLFGGVGPPSGEAAYSTAHDWVFFSRRHLLDCEQFAPEEPGARRLDLYVQYPETGTDVSPATPPSGSTPGAGPTPAGAPAVPTVDPVRVRYVAQLSWVDESSLLTVESERVLNAWREFHADRVPSEALLWPGGPMQASQAEVLVDQVARRMSLGATARVHLQVGLPPVPTTAGSTGALIMIIT